MKIQQEKWSWTNKNGHKLQNYKRILVKYFCKLESIYTTSYKLLKRIPSLPLVASSLYTQTQQRSSKDRAARSSQQHQTDHKPILVFTTILKWASKSVCVRACSCYVSWGSQSWDPHTTGTGVQVWRSERGVTTERIGKSLWSSYNLQDPRGVTAVESVTSLTVCPQK